MSALDSADAKIASLIAETTEYLKRLNSVLPRLYRLRADDFEGVRKLAAAAALNASDLQGALDDLADAARAADCIRVHAAQGMPA